MSGYSLLLECRKSFSSWGRYRSAAATGRDSTPRRPRQTSGSSPSDGELVSNAACEADEGFGVANELEVDTGDLRVAAAGSDALAQVLRGAAASGSVGGQPSAAGVAALDAAIDAVRARQSARVSGQAGDLSVAGVRYDDTDGRSGENISVTV
jgi:hypothetical protein